MYGSPLGGSPARLSEAGDDSEKSELRERKKLRGVAQSSNGELSRSSSPGVLGSTYPVSVRQQLALIKQMEQPSPSGSTDGDGSSNTPTVRKKKRVNHVHKKNDRGETPLHVAARKGKIDDCLYLLEQGADVNSADYAGWTPLHEACNHNRFETASMLLRRGAVVNNVSLDGETPLHDAASSGNGKLVWLLLRHGADRELRDNGNNRPVDSIRTEDLGGTAHQLLLADSLTEECPESEPESDAEPSSPGPSKLLSMPFASTPSRLLGSAVSSRAASEAPPPTDTILTESAVQPPATVNQQPAENTAIKYPIQYIVPPDVPLTVRVESTSPPEADMTPTEDAPPTTTTEEAMPNIDPLEEELLDKEDTMMISTTTAHEMTAAEEEELLMGSSTVAVADITPPVPLVQTTVSGRSLEQRLVDTGLELSEGESSEGSPMVVDTTSRAASEESGDRPAAVVGKSDSQSTEEAIDAAADETSAFEDQDKIMPVVQEEQEPEAMTSDADPMQRLLRPAVWKTTRAGSQPRTAAVSPHNTYDFVEDMEEVRSESGYGKRRGGGRGRGRGRGSGSNTPQSVERKKGPGRGRGGRGRGGRGQSRATEATVNEALASVSIPPDDVYDFRGSPESDGMTDYDDSERSVPPVAKRARMVEMDPDPDSNSGSNHSADVDVFDGDDDDDMERKTRKVPPLRISLKTPSEDDPSEETAQPRGKTVGRGRPGKRQNDQDDAQRMTRSKVRQTGKGLDDGDPYAKKRRVRGSVAPEFVQEESEDQLDESYIEHPPVVDPELLTDVSAAQKVLLLQPHNGVVSMKKALEERWMRDVLDDQERLKQHSTEKYSEYLLNTGDYPLASIDPELNESIEEFNHPGMEPELVNMWMEHEKQRRDMAARLDVESVRLRLLLEEEFIRMEQRRDGSAPTMSAVRVFRESNISNPLVLDEPIRRPPLISRDAFDEKVQRQVKRLGNKHRMEADDLCCTQRTYWNLECRRYGIVATDASVDICVPKVEVKPFNSSF